MKLMWRFFHQLGSPKHFYRIAGAWIPWLAVFCAGFMLVGLYLGLWVAPADYQQGESYRIIFVHVPSAWMSMFIYVVMACWAALGLVFNTRQSAMMAQALAHSLGLAVYDRDLAVIVDNDHRVRRSLDQHPEVGLRFLGMQFVCAHEAGHRKSGIREYTVVTTFH